MPVSEVLETGVSGRRLPATWNRPGEEKVTVRNLGKRGRSTPRFSPRILDCLAGRPTRQQSGERDRSWSTGIEVVSRDVIAEARSTLILRFPNRISPCWSVDRYLLATRWVWPGF